MKKEIHPPYYKKINATCACGASLVTGSTLPAIKTEICSSCHPFYTGKQKLVDTAKRVEKFQARSQAKATVVRSKKSKYAAKTAKKSAGKK